MQIIDTAFAGTSRGTEVTAGRRHILTLIVLDPLSGGAACSHKDTLSATHFVVSGAGFAVTGVLVIGGAVGIGG